MVIMETTSCMKIAATDAGWKRQIWLYLRGGK
jgi:hypothetical protein